jgi:4a-hydroxytetrahydrobiopterin dehydratase
MAERTPERLSASERGRHIIALQGWSYDPKVAALRKSYSFANFAEAFGFMTRIALLAERADHHPEWSNVYNRLEIALTTHDAGGVSIRDVELAQAIDESGSPGPDIIWPNRKG